MGEITDRRAKTDARITDIQERLSAAENVAFGKACVYATGSFGRREAGNHSDLDLFIVGKADGIPGADGREKSLLTRLDDICIKADLIKVSRDLEIPEFSGDGRYLVHYSVHDFTKTLGTPEDDVTNTFTARLLLLLESRALVGQAVYRDVIEDVVAAYWRDYPDHKGSFMPAFLANDILRLWRTFCINYEARTARAPADEKAKGKVKNYKLKHSRMLTCYSAILVLLAIFSREETVTPKDVVDMVLLTPTERLEWLLQQQELNHAHATVQQLLDQYEAFLKASNVGEVELLKQFQDKDVSHRYLDAAYQFGDRMFDALNQIGGGNRFHRLLVV
jgi:hypothetical protein